MRGVGELGWVVSEPLSGLSPFYAGEDWGGGEFFGRNASSAVLFVCGVRKAQGIR